MEGTAISACIVVRNEEPLIGRCLNSVRGVVQEIVLVHDGACDDRTVEIAEAAGARVFFRPAAGHAERHRPFAYEQAAGPWLLRLDADEFLSDELREAIPALTQRDDVCGFAFRWPMWNGARYVSEPGPFRLALFRKERVRLLGMIQQAERCDVVEDVDLRLEHRPLYDNYSWPVMRSKWRRWARIQARELTGDFADIPKFNWEAADWPRRRRLANWLAPLLLVPDALLTFATAFRRERRIHTFGFNAKLAASQAFYVAMVHAFVTLAVYGRAR